MLLIAHPQSELIVRAREKGVPVEDVAIANLSLLDPRIMIRLRRILQKYKVQTLILNLSRDLKAGGKAGHDAGVKRIIYRRGSAIPIRNSRINRRLFSKYVDDVLVNSRATAETVLQNNADLFPKDRITVIPNGIDVGSFETRPDKIYYRKEDDELILVSLGRLEREKNHIFLVDLAIRLRKSGINFRILIGGEGSQRTTIESGIRENGLEKEVILAGFIDDTAAFIHSGDIFLLPSLWEGFGYVLAEAGACGLPCVAFNTGSIPEVVQDGVSGYLTGSGDLEAFTNSVLSLAKDPELLKAMGSSAREFIETYFSRDKVNNMLLEYLQLNDQG